MDESTRGDGMVPLGQALRAMPLEAPAHSAWPLPGARLPRRRRDLRWPLAIAAGLLAVLLLPLDAPSPPGVPAVAGSVATSAGDRVEMSALMSESARLERLVEAALDDGASSATAAAWSLELEERLQSLDAALEANRDPARQLQLWQQRVQLLRNVAAVETSRHYLAAQGRSFDMTLVAAY